MTREIADRRTQIAAAAAVSTAGLVLHNLARVPVQILIGPETLGPLAFSGSGCILAGTNIQDRTER